MKLTCAALLLLLASPAFTQKIEKYYDFQWKETDASHARFYSLMEHTDTGWHRQDYFLHGPSLQMEGWYEDSACKLPWGKFVYAYPNKMVESTGRYLHHKKQGLWLTFYPDGMMADSTMYDSGEPTGTTLHWHHTGYPSDSCVYNIDGSGVQVGWFDNGNPSYAGMLSEGRQKHGKWKYFHKNGFVSAFEFYDHGKFLDKNYFDETGQPMTDTTSKDRDAGFKGGVTAWFKYLDKHLYFPPNYDITNSDQAAVVISLSVDEDG